jgi:hypothetical protein
MFASLEEDIEELERYTKAAEMMQQRRLAARIPTMTDEELLRAYMGGNLEGFKAGVPGIVQREITESIGMTGDPIAGGMGSTNYTYMTIQPEITTSDWLQGIEDGWYQWSDYATLFGDSLESLRFQANLFADDFSLSADEIAGIADTEGEAMGNLADNFEGVETAMANFASAREELFYGGKGGLMQGDFMKTVVTKGVENLYSNVELLMTNNFYGLSMTEAVDMISEKVLESLTTSGVNPVYAE